MGLLIEEKQQTTFTYEIAWDEATPDGGVEVTLPGHTDTKTMRHLFAVNLNLYENSQAVLNQLDEAGFEQIGWFQVPNGKAQDSYALFARKLDTA